MGIIPDVAHQTRAQRIGHDIAGNRTHVILSAQGPVMEATLPRTAVQGATDTVALYRRTASDSVPRCSCANPCT